MELSRAAAAVFIWSWRLPLANSQVVVISEGFDDVVRLAGNGWVLTNVSSPRRATGWFQGAQTDLHVAGRAPGPTSPPTTTTRAGGTIDNWLISPMFSTALAGTVTFWLRGGNPGFADH